MGKPKLAAGSPRLLAVQDVSAIVGAAQLKTGPVDLERLCQDINFALTEYRWRRDLRSAEAVKREIKVAADVSQTARKLADTLDADGLMVDLIATRWTTGQLKPRRMYSGAELRRIIDNGAGMEPEPEPPTAAQVVFAIRQLERTASEQLRRLEKSWLASGWPATESPFNWLVGKKLAALYKQHFRHAAAISRPSSNGEPRGPYVTFVVAVLTTAKIDNIGQPYSRETIASALTAAKKASKPT